MLGGFGFLANWHTNAGTVSVCASRMCVPVECVCASQVCHTEMVRCYHAGLAFKTADADAVKYFLISPSLMQLFCFANCKLIAIG